MKYILFGAGPYLREHIDEEKIKYFEYIVDSDEKKIGTTYLGKEIREPRVLLDEDKENIFIVITAFGQMYSIAFDLKAMGFEEGKHFEWLERLYNHYPLHSLWLKRKSENWESDESTWRETYPNGMIHERAQLVAKMISWENVNSVLDLGAGSEPMRGLLPKDITYYPIDYKQLTGKTLVYDFNKKQFPDITADVVIMVGVNGYVDYEAWLIEKAVGAVNSNGQLILSLHYSIGNYNVLDFITKHNDTMVCVDYAFRSATYGIFKFRKVK